VINLSFPTANEIYYAMLGDVVVGPFGPTGTSSGELISYRAKHDYLEQGSTSHDENNVEHRKIEGELTFVPAARDMTSAPTVQYPIVYYGMENFQIVMRRFILSLMVLL
jgi:hypothetical protein